MMPRPSLTTDALLAEASAFAAMQSALPVHAIQKAGTVPGIIRIR